MPTTDLQAVQDLLRAPLTSIVESMCNRHSECVVQIDDSQVILGDLVQ